MENLRRRYPQGRHARFVTPQEVSGLIAYLLSDSAAPLTGSAIPVDYGIAAGY